LSSRLFQRLENNETAFGANCDINQSEIMEISGAVGLDFLIIDMMMNSVDWRTVAAMTLAADHYGITPGIRLPSYPWVGDKAGVDFGLNGQILRAIAVGVQDIVVSLETVEQIEAALLPIADPHRRVYLPSYEYAAHGNKDERASTGEDAVRTMLTPLIESERAIEDLDQILAVPGLESIFLGMGDLSVILGHENDYTHPDLAKFIGDVVVRADRNDVAVFANIHGRSSQDDVVAGVEEYRNLGVKAIYVARDSAVLVRYYTELLGIIR
jgi:2-keto-3-deoxy-L-rhamnonate aldolase RhmA